jgi:hypothetical protein
MTTITRSIHLAVPVHAAFAWVKSEWEDRLGFWTEGIEGWTPSTTPLTVGF